MALPKKRFIVLLADGARYDVFRELLDAGRLPAIEEAFLQTGSFAKATSVFPSTTGPAYLPYLTGCFPGTCNVPGIRWFDKSAYSKKKFGWNRFRSYVGPESFLMNRDIRPEVKTLFDYFPKSFNIFSAVNRGVSSGGNLTAYMRLWYWYYAHLTDRWASVDSAALEMVLSTLEKDFEFLFVVLPGIDTYSHLSRPRHPRVMESYRFVDGAIDKIYRKLRLVGKWEETALFIVSDHGLSETHQHFGVGAYLESLGLKTLYYPRIAKQSFEAASMVSGNAMLHLYLRGDNPWSRRTCIEQIRESYPALFTGLMDSPAVDLLLSQDQKGWIHVHSREGEARVREQDGDVEFQTIRGRPLGKNLMEGRYTPLEALRLTLDSPYPDSWVQISQLFRSPRTGDLVISASKGYDLRKRFEHPEHKSSHGALHDEHMLVPLLSSVRMARDRVRSADLFPSILKLRGIPVPAGIDGISFL